MNWVDLAVIVFLVIFAIEGLGRSLVGELLGFLSFLFAFLAALSFYNKASYLFQNNFNIPLSIANVLGFLAVWFVCEFLLYTLSRIFLEQFKKPHFFGVFDFLAVVPAFLRGLVFVSIILVLIGTFPVQPKIKLAIDQSRIGPPLLTQARRIEQPLKNIFGGVTYDSLTFFTIKPKSNETVKLGFQTLDYKPSPSLEDDMVVLVNAERAKVGLAPLVISEQLRYVGRGHSEDMFKRGYFAHYSPEGKTVADRAQALNIEFGVIGENLAFAPDLKLAHNGLMNSPGHRANILSQEYLKIGIGVMDGGVYGLMITQVFSD